MNTAKVIEFAQQPSAADVALAEMRAQFGRNGAASRWSRLPTKARAIVCYAAEISPELGKSMELHDFDVTQREAIRLALSDLLATLREFDGSVLHRYEWHRSPHHVEGPSRSELEQAEHEINQRALLNEKANTLESRIAAMRRVPRNGQ
ncbi:hypothetical protein [Aeromonas salmonicida]|uniref:hypothetical protein n=1 Tax=Aeromonas salmonicida TaxID=645 RepID=UPI00240DC46F|nr:hypothetical protein [Aeromonas salmonicida]WFC12687.1 hypothetical protein L3V47_13110 [Aeromonas salmonicida]